MSPSPRASCGGKGARGAPEHPRGQERRADLQLQHVRGRQLRPGVELCAAWEARLGGPSRELRAVAGSGAGGGWNRGPSQDEGAGQRGWVWGSACLDKKKKNGFFLDLSTTVCLPGYPLQGSVHPPLPYLLQATPLS